MFGGLRQKVRNMQAEQAKFEERLCTVEEAVIRATDVKNDVNMLRQQVEAGQKLAAATAQGSSDLINEKVEGLGREVRTFLQGMSAAGAKLPAAVRSRAS